jgi:hypothetical protein
MYYLVRVDTILWIESIVISAGVICDQLYAPTISISFSSMIEPVLAAVVVLQDRLKAISWV